MNNNIAIVFTTGILAALNPSLLAAVAVMSLLPQPKRLMTGYLLGAYTTSLASGLAIVDSLHGSGAARTSTQLLSPAGEIAIGAIALTAAFVMATGHDARLRDWRERRKAASARHRQGREPWQVRMLGRGSMVVTFVVGAAVSFPGVTYVNALDHIARLNPSTVSVLLLIVYFVVMQQILLEGALLASVFAEKWTQAAIVRFKAWLARHGHQIATVGLSAVGILLAGRGLLAVQ